MGSIFGLKIINIQNSPKLSQLKLSTNSNRQILPFIYFITKLNGISIDKFSKKSLVNSISLINIITKENFDISFENIQCSELFSNLLYEFKEVPEIKQILLVSQVKENSLSEQFGIQKEKNILIGIKEKYFSEINEVSIAIESGKKEFIFYDYEKDEIKICDYSKSENNFGFELQEITIEDFFNFFYNKVKAKKAREIDINEENIKENPTENGNNTKKIEEDTKKEETKKEETKKEETKKEETKKEETKEEENGNTNKNNTVDNTKPKENQKEEEKVEEKIEKDKLIDEEEDLTKLEENFKKEMELFKNQKENSEVNSEDLSNTNNNQQISSNSSTDIKDDYPKNTTEDNPNTAQNTQGQNIQNEEEVNEYDDTFNI